MITRVDPADHVAYAGIGSRATPPLVLRKMAWLGQSLGRLGYTLRSGGADGADSYFEEGCGPGDSEIYYPWRGFARMTLDPVIVCDLPNYQEIEDLASKFHPAWHNCSQGARKLFARNVCQMLGSELDKTSDFVVCWTINGKDSGGTGHAIRVAQHYEIPIVNLWDEKKSDALFAEVHEALKL